jgi:nucleotide-binding universal stress UspA family protein
MSVLLVALDDSAAARPVLDVARRMAPYVRADVVAVHVQENGSGATARAVAESVGVTLCMRSGEIVEELTSALRELHASAIVVGARGVPSGARPCGHVAMGVLEQFATGVVVVPPGAVDRPISRVVVSVEGDGESEALASLIAQLDDLPGPEVVALHVFELTQLPAFGDQPILETEAWASEFLRRIARAPVDRVRLEVRVGDVLETVPEAVRELGADLVVMGWHRRLSGGHGRVVRRMLESSSVPLLLLPVRSTATVVRVG